MQFLSVCIMEYRMFWFVCAFWDDVW